MAEWIVLPSERKPCEGQDVYVTIRAGGTNVAISAMYTQGSFKSYIGTFKSTGVLLDIPKSSLIAWMPLPEPYKESEE